MRGPSAASWAAIRKPRASSASPSVTCHDGIARIREPIVRVVIGRRRAPAAPVGSGRRSAARRRRRRRRVGRVGGAGRRRRRPRPRGCIGIARQRPVRRAPQARRRRLDSSTPIGRPNSRLSPLVAPRAGSGLRPRRRMPTTTITTMTTSPIEASGATRKLIVSCAGPGRPRDRRGGRRRRRRAEDLERRVRLGPAPALRQRARRRRLRAEPASAAWHRARPASPPRTRRRHGRAPPRTPRRRRRPSPYERISSTSASRPSTRTMWSTADTLSA